MKGDMEVTKILPFDIKYIDDIYGIELDSFSIPWSKDSLEKDAIENKMSIYLVALEDEKVVGYAGMWHVVTEGHITNVAVSPDFRRRGIADMLLTELTNIAVKKEMIGITLEVRMNNVAAQGLYLKHGYKVEGIRKNYYSDTKEDAIIMWKYL